MTTYVLRQTRVTLEGKVSGVSMPFMLAAGEQPLISVSMVPDSAHAAALLNAAGVANPFGEITCSVRIKATAFGLPLFTQRFHALVGKTVRIAGSLCDATVPTTGQTVSAIYPLGLLVAAAPLEVYDIDGWPVAVRDYDVFAFSHIRSLLGDPGVDESRTLSVTVPFPWRPSGAATPFFRLYPEPLLDEVASHDLTLAPAVANGPDTLTITVETGLVADGHGALIGQIGLSYDEPELADFCPPGTCTHDGKWCSFEGDLRYMRVPPQVPYAQPGDLALSPGDGRGIISGVVAAVKPFQVYDHMGLFIDNGRTIRHCTASADRAEAEDLFTQQFTIRFAGLIEVAEHKVPAGGLRDDVLRFSWPGAITQTVEEVYRTGRNTLNPRWTYAARYPAIALTDPLDSNKPFRVYQVAPEARRVRLFFIDPERHTPGDVDVTEGIVRLQDAPTFPPDPARPGDPPRRWDAVLVKPQPQVEAEVRPSLQRVVDAAKKIEAHYRFFAYSRGEIGVLPEFNAPPAGDPVWAGLPAGADWCAGTIGAMCSSFVWTAVQHANDRRPVGSLPIVLEDRREPEDANTGRVYGAFDGLYRYEEDERAGAAKGLVKYLAAKIKATFDDSIPGVVYAATPGLAGLRDTTAANVANQTANAFAFDSPHDLGETWRSPGRGETIGPQQTADFWDIKPIDGAVRHPGGGLGVYGQVIALQLSAPRWQTVPLFRKRDDDPGRGQARFIVLLDGAVVAGATVRIDFGCFSCVSTANRELAATLQLEAGRHFGEAFMIVKNPATGNDETFRTTAPAEFMVTAGSSVDVVLRLQPPDDLWRVIDVVIDADIHDRSFWGGDSDARHIVLTPSFELRQDLSDPPGAGKEERNTVLSAEHYWRTEPAVGSGVHIGLSLTAKFDPADRSVTCHCRTALYDTSDGGIFGLLTSHEVDQIDEQEVRVAADQTRVVLNGAAFASDETVPERATVTVKITNRRRPS